MCRLAFGNFKTLELVNKNTMTSIFSDLEKMLGGHGNGFACQKLDGGIYQNKGVELSVKEIAEILYKLKPALWMFHTRFVSSGKKADSQCHPHECRNRNDKISGFLCQNGTLPDALFNFFKNAFGGAMDTQSIANSIFKTSVDPMTFLFSLDNSIWVLLKKDTLFAVNSYKTSAQGDLVFYPELSLGMSNDLISDVESFKINGKGSVELDISGKNKFDVGKVIKEKLLFDLSYFG